MDKKEKDIKIAKYAILVLICFWLIVGIIIFISNHFDKNIFTGETGDIVLQEEEETEDIYSEYAPDGEKLYNNGTVKYIDNNELISGGNVFSTKGYIYFNFELTDFLEENGYTDIKTVTVISDEITESGAYKSFDVQIDGTEDTITVTYDRIADSFSFELHISE